MYFNGFALRDEEHFFDAFMKKSAYVISGFSYGAIKAFQEARQRSSRIDTLLLISPAFFQSKNEKFKRLQLIGYIKDCDAYIKKFTENCFLPYAPQQITYSDHTVESLEELLHYSWNVEELQALVAKGTRIEVYLGSEDKITDVEAAYDFFLPYATVHLIKGANHFLQGEQYE